MKVIGIEEGREKIKKINKKKLTVLIIISVLILTAIILFCVYMGNKTFRDFMDKYVLMKNVTENNLNSITLEEPENIQVYAYDKYISVFSQNKLVGYNSNGKKEYELSVEITNPIIDTNNRFLLIAEKEKQRIYLISGNNIVWQKDLEGNISRINVNKNGYVSVIITGTTYKSIIQTFDSQGNEMFKTYLSNSIAMDSDISSDNKYMSFAEISTNGTTVQSRIKTVSIQKAKEKEASSDPIISNIASPTDSVALSIKYQDSNRLVCMYDDSIHILQNGADEELLKLKEDGQKVVFGDIKLNNFVVRILEKSVLLSTQSTVEFVNVGSKKTNIYTIDSVVKEIYVNNNYIALNLGSEVYFVGTNGWLNKKYTSSQEVRKVVINNECAGIVYRDKIEIINL
jgi:hypothetical protein